MKKLFTILSACVLLFTASACSNSRISSGADTSSSASQATSQSSEITSSSGATLYATSESELDNTHSPEAAGTKENNSSAPVGKSLVVYFSWSGNTEAVAAEIQRQTDADLFEIVPETPYTDDYNVLLNLAQEEQRNSARPAISGSIDLPAYDTIYLGFPIWWGDMPMVLYTFLDNYDLSGKTLAPFVTSGGSGFSGTIDTIESMESGATLTEGLSLNSSQAEDCSEAVSQWLRAVELV